MASLDKNYELVEEYEHNFAMSVAARVIPRPKLNVWMILVPILLVYFFMHKTRYKTGCQEFSRHYMVSRRNALDAVKDSLESGGQPDLEMAVQRTKLPGEALDAYRDLMGVLMRHYRDLFGVDGNSYDDLVHLAYQNKSNYMLYNNRLNSVEKTLNVVLSSQVTENPEGYTEAVEKIEQASEKLRREHVERVF